MLSTADLLACHHDAKLAKIPDNGSPDDRREPARRRPSPAFRPGLRVRVAGEARPAVACWVNEGAVLVFEEA